jgi:hypothetical protein
LRLDKKWNELRNSGIICCLELTSDYYYCYEVRWAFDSTRKHKFYQTRAFDTAQQALDSAYKRITATKRWKEYKNSVVLCA